MYINKALSIAAIIFLFFVAQFASVWMNEELLLVISFCLFYFLSFTQLRHSLNEFFITRRNEFVKNPAIYLKQLAFEEVKNQKQNQYSNAINLFHFIKMSLEQNNNLINSSENTIDKTKNKVFGQKCVSILKNESVYMNNLLNPLQNIILENTFSIDKKKFLINRIVAGSRNIKKIY